MDPETDVRVLVLAWKLKSEEKPGEIKKSEFRAGYVHFYPKYLRLSKWHCGDSHEPTSAYILLLSMQEMRCESVEELKTRALPSLDLGFMEHKEFREFYRYFWLDKSLVYVTYFYCYYY